MRWSEVLYPQRRRLLDALDSPEVRTAMAAKLDPLGCENTMGPEMTFDEEAALDAAIAALEDVESPSGGGR